MIDDQGNVPMPLSARAAMAASGSTDVVMVGSFTMDFTATAVRMPELGETVLGTGFTMVPGGKGNNQAVAASRAGARVSVVGCVGDDALADLVVEGVVNEGCATAFLSKVPGPTGVAHIAVDQSGNNRIIMVPLANSALDEAAVGRAEDVLAEAEVLLVQLEVPLAAVAESLRLAHKYGVTTILNPAPAAELSDDLLGLVHYLVPNESEAAVMTGIDTSSREGCLEAARILLARGAHRVIVTRGSAGALLVGTANGEGGSGGIDLPPLQVHSVDATAAGDAFCGTLAAEVAKTRRADGWVSDDALARALRRAGAAGALATTVLGALPSLPSCSAVDELLARS
jgi:ribokinase